MAGQVKGSPAHAGIDRCFVRALRGRCGGSPAHAGIDRTCTVSKWNGCGFPRTRGDRPITGIADLNEKLVPPHTRG